MAYKVIIQKQAESDIVSAFNFIVERGAPEAAGRWFLNIRAEIKSLSDKPERFPLAPEADKLGFEIRQLHYGKRSGTYRILFRILKETREVHILAVRHGARKEIEPEDIE